jgi:two-component system chemotaxis response regulator CheY
MNGKVLVLDDSMMVRRQVASALGAAGFEVVEAADGAEGLERLAQAPVDLVVCDVNMPRMGGLEFLEVVRERKASTAPVVMLTTEGEPSMVTRARALGAKGWIIKPFKPELLVAAARKLTGAAP